MCGCMPLKMFLYLMRSSVLLNGVLVGKTFYLKRGTRQRDPFSTFCCGLFVLPADFLRTLVNHAKDQG